jgi:hypothetical protein
VNTLPACLPRVFSLVFTVPLLSQVSIRGIDSGSVLNKIDVSISQPVAVGKSPPCMRYLIHAKVHSIRYQRPSLSLSPAPTFPFIRFWSIRRPLSSFNRLPLLCY